MQRLIPLLVLSLLIGCGQSETKTQETAKPAEQTATAPAQPPATESAQPAATEAIPAPTEATASSFRGDPVKGSAIYAQFCATCHGPTGAGDGPAAAALNPKPASHNDPVFMATLTDEVIFNAIKNGGISVGKSPLMPPWGATLSDEQVRDVLAHVRTLAKTN